jgi:hypothetical protein
MLMSGILRYDLKMKNENYYLALDGGDIELIFLRNIQ